MEKQGDSFIDLGGVNIYYETAGKGIPLVFLHAGFVDSGMWKVQWLKLGDNFRYVRYDGQGFGHSDPLTIPVSRRMELRAFLDKLELDKVILVGCSLGGETVLDFALESAGRVAGLVLISTVPGGFIFQGPPPKYLLEMISAVEKEAYSLATELQMRLWVDGPFRSESEADPCLREEVARMSTRALLNGSWGLTMAPQSSPLDPPAVQRLDQINIPTLVIVGALDNPEITRAGELMSTSIQNSHFESIGGSAHLPNMEKPEEFNRVLGQFLQQFQG